MFYLDPFRCPCTMDPRVLRGKYQPSVGTPKAVTIKWLILSHVLIALLVPPD
jgi:hypothetical protein